MCDCHGHGLPSQKKLMRFHLNFQHLLRKNGKKNPLQFLE